MAKRKQPSKTPVPVPSGSKFDPSILDRTTIATPLLDEIQAEQRAADKARASGKKPKPKQLHDVVIDLNLDYNANLGEGVLGAKRAVLELIEATTTAARGQTRDTERVYQRKTALVPHYVFARLYGETILSLVQIDRAGSREKAKKKSGAQSAGGTPYTRAIYRIWPDFAVEPLTNRSIATVKADAAHRAFNALGAGIVWAVIDSGVKALHPHFKMHRTLDLPKPLEHIDFSNAADGQSAKATSNTALDDQLGHGTHVAGIIAGQGDPKHMRAVMRRRDEGGDTVYDPVVVEKISGMAPLCKIVSLRVLDAEGRGNVSSIIAALAQIQEWNGHGRRIIVHGVNLSVGYGFNAEWFACGQSPLCVEVDRLVKTGVVVVVAAGNTGYGSVMSDDRGDVKAGLGLTINDPGNAELAITVGSTHRDMPYTYGVSYFSSKGPTGDGRVKPDLVAPGERILSCAQGAERERAKASLTRKDSEEIDYVELSGTSMAAPHVSGVVAAFLSVRTEFIGRPEVVKSILLSNATDLKRERYFQGHGLVDLMRAIQSV